MPAVITRNGNRLLLGAALLLTVLVLLGTALIALLIQTQQQASCGAGGVIGGPPGPSEQAIPAPLMPLYQAAEKTYRVPWNVLAAINKVETDFGRNLNVSSAGAIGGMQFMPDTWARYGIDGNHDGRKDAYDPEDAIPAAGNYLRASGAAQDLHAAILAYNHAEWYYQEVMSWAREFVQGPIVTTSDPASPAPAVTARRPRRATRSRGRGRSSPPPPTTRRGRWATGSPTTRSTSACRRAPACWPSTTASSSTPAARCPTAAA